MDVLRLVSPAKVNLRLDVLYKRDDGYHEIRTILQRISLCDEVEISLKKGGIDISSEGIECPQYTDNIAYHAAKMILDRLKGDTGVRILIKKKIPIASGLGGGSSNAAATLIGMNRILKLGLTKRELMDMGTQLGADVPFFICQKPSLATGIGDRLKTIVLPSPMWMVLVNPKIRVSTAWAYESLNIGLTKKKNNISMLTPFIGISDVVDFLYNDLEAVTIKRFPEVQKIKEELIDKGAAGALMSGSGPTVFGIFFHREMAEKAFHRLSIACPDYSVFLTSNFGNN
ncbi:MAG: 4-(cytidine 5'-diphospho)-2-C-methyl-D-erythritol kinase [Thermodesulfobacteriota bacterium]|nr:4-(cytidine 5'-diphospho)-2-C-methyl-D-erythritol kinase [Thermodesulfobacteriota bacterium]